MVVNSRSDHRGNWRDAGFSNDASPKTTCHVAASQLSESNALSPFGGREPSAKVQLSYNRTYWDPRFCGNNRYYTTTCAGLQDVGESFSRIPF